MGGLLSRHRDAKTPFRRDQVVEVPPSPPRLNTANTCFAGFTLFRRRPTLDMGRYDYHPVSGVVGGQRMARARYIANEFSVATAAVPFGAELATTTEYSEPT